MRLTAKSEYGVLAAIELASCYGRGPVSAREIAERRAIPVRFLEQLFVALRRGGLVTAVRGARGGFSLARDPREITVLDIVEALEGPLSTSMCDSERDQTCGKSSCCAASSVWMQATSALKDVFSSASLADLAARQEEYDGRTAAI